MEYNIKAIDDEMIEISLLPAGEPFIIPHDTVEEVYITTDIYFTNNAKYLMFTDGSPVRCMYISLLTGRAYFAFPDKMVIPVDLL